MKRYHSEKHIITRRVKAHKQINAGMDTWWSSLQNDWKRQDSVEQGYYRKALRCAGCTRARCQICHPEKYPKRKPTRQEKQNWRNDE